MVEDFKERTVSGLNVRIDRTRCVATTNCIKIAPGVFELDDERIVAFKSEVEEPGPDIVVEACDACPVDTFSVFDAGGRRIVPT